VAAGPDFAHCIQAQAGWADVQRRQKLGHHLQQVTVQNELLKGAGQATLHPTGGVHDEVATGLGQRPEGEHRLIGRLRVHRVGGANVGSAVGNAVLAAQLPACQHGLHVLGRAKGRRASFHVHVGCKAAVHHRGTWAHHLGEGNAGQCLGVLLGQRAGDGDRRHSAGQRERRQDNDLVACRHLNNALQHRCVQP
jgi:hypothetical protein